LSKHGPEAPRAPADADPLSSVRDDVAQRLFDAALAGARALMAYWRCAVGFSSKADGSLVSVADHAADAAVRRALLASGVAAPLISEESQAQTSVGDELFLLLDPLDGTAEFLGNGEEFCVCLAAIHRGRPIAGAIIAPALRRGWFAGSSAAAVTLDADLAPRERQPLHARLRPERPTQVGLVSRRHGDPRSEEAVRRTGVGSTLTASSAIKFGMLAEGRADIHVRHGRTMTWDIAAGDVILGASGGKVLSLTGQELIYNDMASGFANPPFIAVSRADLAAPLLEAVQRAS
jgi:3'(2'), 5'-bisphosphate nucleotidase